MLASTGLLIGFLAVASVTDVTRKKIYNAITYPGMLAGLTVRTVESGWMGFADGLWGFFACGLLVLICFVLFQLGGGDVKLIAMMGAFLGLHRGIEAMLWTFILGAVMGVALLVWQIGFWQICGSVWGYLKMALRARGPLPLTKQEREPLQQWLYLAPAALAAVLLMTVLEWKDG